MKDLRSVKELDRAAKAARIIPIVFWVSIFLILSVMFIMMYLYGYNTGYLTCVEDIKLD